MLQKNGYKELEESDILEVYQTKRPRKGQTLCGYGKQLPTTYVVVTKDKRHHRVRVICFSNGGSPYITIKGQTVMAEMAIESWEIRHKGA